MEDARQVFINCPFDATYAPLLDAACFCLMYLGFTPRLASESRDGGGNRLERIVAMIRAARYSIHDLSRTTAGAAGETFRMNMPFELGIDEGLRRSGAGDFAAKRFLIFEGRRYSLKAALSDIAGQDPEHHDEKYDLVIRKVRHFLWTEAGAQNAKGDKAIGLAFATWQGWLFQKKLHEGHSEEGIAELPTLERLAEMRRWIELGEPPVFAPEA